MKTILFINWTTEEFKGYWDGKERKVKAGEQIYMPDYLAAHFAKHLTNRELLRKKDGKFIHENGEKYTSPKFPEQVPVFKELFDRAYKADESETIGERKDDINTLIDIANKNRQKANADIASKVTGSNEAQIIPSDDEDDEASFK